VYEVCNKVKLVGVSYIHTFTFLVFRTQQGSQQTTTGKTLIMSSLDDTSHSMLFHKKHDWAPEGPNLTRSIACMCTMFRSKNFSEKEPKVPMLAVWAD